VADPAAVDIARRFFRVIEHDDGTWACRDGRHVIDHHDNQDDALTHVALIASDYRPARIYLHHLNGRVSPVATLD
jgi:hypothetical protein